LKWLWDRALRQKRDVQGVRKRLALFLKDRFDLLDFVETGTYFGTSAAWAAEHFRRVYTIEASEELGIPRGGGTRNSPI
jgi:predicted O-methyltransferase YrrM